MTKVHINKIEAARRQIDAAIRMTFGEEDPVAIYLVLRRRIVLFGIFAIDAAISKASTIHGLDRARARKGILQILESNGKFP
jgi:valyl-tRNA synthetase